jgi:hypothetical protein
LVLFQAAGAAPVEGLSTPELDGGQLELGLGILNVEIVLGLGRALLEDRAERLVEEPAEDLPDLDPIPLLDQAIL